jgi:hypothetical protein
VEEEIEKESLSGGKCKKKKNKKEGIFFYSHDDPWIHNRPIHTLLLPTYNEWKTHHPILP